ncbi:MAG TPA: TlpA disulfide reductase family protein [bacterium]
MSRTRSTRGHHARHGLLIGLAGFLGAGLIPAGAAAQDPRDRPFDRIKLDDGTEFSARLVKRYPDQVLVMIPRERMESINGDALPQPILPGYAAPPFTAVDLNGIEQALPDPDVPVTLIAFWATWCPYCRKDLPFIKALYERYHEPGFRILAPSIDENLDTLTAFVRAQELEFPVIATGLVDDEADPSDAHARDLSFRYEIQGTPVYFLVDGKGMVREVFYGAVVNRKSYPEKMESSIRELLAASGADLPPPLEEQPAAASER